MMQSALDPKHPPTGHVFGGSGANRVVSRFLYAHEQEGQPDRHSSGCSAALVFVLGPSRLLYQHPRLVRSSESPCGAGPPTRPPRGWTTAGPRGGSRVRDATLEKGPVGCGRIFSVTGEAVHSCPAAAPPLHEEQLETASSPGEENERTPAAEIFAAQGASGRPQRRWRDEQSSPRTF